MAGGMSDGCEDLNKQTTKKRKETKQNKSLASMHTARAGLESFRSKDSLPLYPRGFSPGHLRRDWGCEGFWGDLKGFRGVVKDFRGVVRGLEGVSEVVKEFGGCEGWRWGL